MQWIRCGCPAVGAALVVVACTGASEPRPAGNDHGVPSGQGNPSSTISSGTRPAATEIAVRELDPGLRREIGLDPEGTVDPDLHRGVGPPQADLDPQLRREIGLDPALDLTPDLRREIGLDPQAP
jgi:hypothetical protein